MLNTSGKGKLTRTERQLQLILKALTEQFLEHEGSAESVQVVANLHQYQAEVLVSSEIIEIAICIAETRELFAFVRYHKQERHIVYSLKFSVVEECLRDLILLSRMNAFG